MKAPCSSRGKLDLKSSGKRLILRGALSPGFTDASAKAHRDQIELPGALKRPYPA